MSITITILDPTTQNVKNIFGEIYSSFIETDNVAELEFYIQLTTSARRQNGDAVPPRYITSLSDLADTTSQHGTATADPYASLQACIEDFVLCMVEGDGAGQAMQF